MNEIAARALFDQDVRKITERLLIARNWKLYTREFPVLDIGFRASGRNELRLRFIAKNWDDDPPSIILLNAEGGFLTQQQLQVMHYPNVFNINPHPLTNRPFVCMAGSLEYHNHTNHLNDSWDNYKRRDAYTLGGIMHQLWSAWQKSKL